MQAFQSTLCFLLIILLMGCRKSLNPSQYYTWNNDKKGVLSKWIFDKYYNFNVTYRPIDFMALSGLNGEQLTNSKFKESKKGFLCCRHFMIKIYAKDTSDVLKYKIRSEQEYYDRVRYLSSEIGNYLKLVDGNDTLNCTFFHYERTYKMQSFATVMAFFERKRMEDSEEKPMKLILKTGGFNPKDMAFNFTENDLKQIPNLSF